MADSKISALPASTTPLAGTEVLPIVQSSATKQVSVANLTAGRAISATSIQLGSGTVLSTYEEGTWTPVLTFQTPGDLSIAYSSQTGSYTKIGNRVILQGYIVTSSFTFTTASGYARINGIPFNGSSGSNRQNYGTLVFGGITKIGYTDFATSIEPGVNSSVLIYCSASAVSPTFISASDMPTGGSVSLKFTMTYEV